MSKVRLAIIGNGMVGHRFIEDLPPFTRRVYLLPEPAQYGRYSAKRAEP